MANRSGPTHPARTSSTTRCIQLFTGFLVLLLTSIVLDVWEDRATARIFGVDCPKTALSEPPERDMYGNTPKFLETTEFACISRHRERLGLGRLSFGEVWRRSEGGDTVVLGKGNAIYLFAKSYMVRDWILVGKIFSCEGFDRMSFDFDPSIQTFAVTCRADPGDGYDPFTAEVFVVEKPFMRRNWSSKRIYSVPDSSCNNMGINVQLAPDANLITMEYYRAVRSGRRLDQAFNDDTECHLIVRRFERMADDDTWNQTTS